MPERIVHVSSTILEFESRPHAEAAADELPAEVPLGTPIGGRPPKYAAYGPPEPEHPSNVRNWFGFEVQGRHVVSVQLGAVGEVDRSEELLALLELSNQQAGSLERSGLRTANGQKSVQLTGGDRPNGGRCLGRRCLRRASGGGACPGRRSESRERVDHPSGLPWRWALFQEVRPRFGVRRLLASPSRSGPCADWWPRASLRSFCCARGGGRCGRGRPTKRGGPGRVIP